VDTHRVRLPNRPKHCLPDSTPRIAYVLVPRLNRCPYTHNYRQSPSLSCISTDAPARIRETIMDPCPLREAAIRAVSPSLFRISTDAPARIRESTMDPCPLREARIRAVSPSLFCIY